MLSLHPLAGKSPSFVTKPLRKTNWPNAATLSGGPSASQLGSFMAPDPRGPSLPTRVGKVGRLLRPEEGQAPAAGLCESVCGKASAWKAGEGARRWQSSRAAAHQAEVAVLCSSF